MISELPKLFSTVFSQEHIETDLSSTDAEEDVVIYILVDIHSTDHAITAHFQGQMIHAHECFHDNSADN